MYEHVPKIENCCVKHRMTVFASGVTRGLSQGGQV